MKNLIPVFVLIILLSSCVSYKGQCVPKAIILLEQNPKGVALLGRTESGTLHCEAVEIVNLTSISSVYVPLDGNNTIEVIIPNNKSREWFTLSEVKKAHWNPNHE